MGLRGRGESKLDPPKIPFFREGVLRLKSHFVGDIHVKERGKDSEGGEGLQKEAIPGG